MVAMGFFSLNFYDFKSVLFKFAVKIASERVLRMKKSLGTNNLTNFNSFPGDRLSQKIKV